jgi:hypothetical protein
MHKQNDDRLKKIFIAQAFLGFLDGRRNNNAAAGGAILRHLRIKVRTLPLLDHPEEYPACYLPAGHSV